MAGKEADFLVSETEVSTTELATVRVNAPIPLTPQKLTFDSIMIEITRRCNLKCAHCLRGDAQDVDIAYETIDNLLIQTESIYSLFFTGGEPALNISAMQYTPSQLKALQIPLYAVELTTNGFIHSGELVEVLRGFKMYIESCASRDADLLQSVRINVSRDRYHTGYEPIEAARFYRRELGHGVHIEIDRRGDNPVRIGRARKLPNAQEPSILFALPHQIHTLVLGEPCECRYASEWKGIHDGQRIVCCRLHLSANGDLTPFSAYEGEYKIEDSNHERIICNLSRSQKEDHISIEQAIDKYNLGKMTCNTATDESAAKQAAEYQNNPRKMLLDLRAGLRALDDPEQRDNVRRSNPVAFDTLKQSPQAREYLEMLCSPADFL